MKIWDNLMARELKKPYMIQLVDFLKQQDQTRIIYPPRDERLNCFKLTPLDQVKVVIIGQDPYHGPNQAHGLSFSVKDDKYPPSLQNIFKELVTDIGCSYPKTGNLTKWAKQGVLLLNTVLTVEKHKPLSHQNKGWEYYTKEVVKVLNSQDRPIVFILWGRHARNLKTLLNNPKHLIIENVHPSPLSAHNGFFGSKPFSQTNAFFQKSGSNPIDWNLNEA